MILRIPFVFLFARRDDSRRPRRVAVKAGHSKRRKASAPASPKAQITPHWFAEDTKFWYRNDLKGGAREFITSSMPMPAKPRPGVRSCQSGGQAGEGGEH